MALPTEEQDFRVFLETEYNREDCILKIFQRINELRPNLAVLNFVFTWADFNPQNIISLFRMALEDFRQFNYKFKMGKAQFLMYRDGREGRFSKIYVVFSELCVAIGALLRSIFQGHDFTYEIFSDSLGVDLSDIDNGRFIVEMWIEKNKPEDRLSDFREGLNYLETQEELFGEESVDQDKLNQRISKDIEDENLEDLERIERELLAGEEDLSESFDLLLKKTLADYYYGQYLNQGKQIPDEVLTELDKISDEDLVRFRKAFVRAPSVLDFLRSPGQELFNPFIYFVNHNIMENTPYNLALTIILFDVLGLSLPDLEEISNVGLEEYLIPYKFYFTQ